jgi:DNA primase
MSFFSVGQMGNTDRLIRDCLARFGSSRLKQCGLVVERWQGEELIFPSGYLLFPFTIDGTVSYIQGRRADGGAEKRWICPAGIRPAVFNLDALSRPAPTITICEGLTDVLSAHELGMTALGLLGANSTLDDEVIARLNGRNVAVVGDADAAGEAFAKRIATQLKARGLTVFRKRLPAGVNDLNDYLRFRARE